MKSNWLNWPKRFIGWLFGGPFRQLPPAFGNPVPPDLQAFEDQAEEAQHHGLGQTAAPVPQHHAKTKPARYDDTLERQ